MQKKKIAIFTGYAIPHLGGVERYVDKLSAALKNIGYEIIIVTSNHADLPAQEVINGIKMYRLPIKTIAKERYPIPDINDEYKRIMQLVEHENADIYLLNTRFHLTSHVGARLGSRKQRPVMLIEHGTDHFTVNNKILDYFGKIYEHMLTMYIKTKVDKYYGVSKKCNEWLRHFNIHADGVFYNSVDKKDTKNVKDYYSDIATKDAIVITYAGRLIKEKGVLNLLEAFKRLEKESDRRLVLAIAGDGPLLKTIKQQYNHPNIVALGRLDFNHVMSLYKRTDIFVYPSLYPEGLPTSILEAALMDCAIIATPRGGTQEVIPDEDHGIIIEGSIESLQESLSLLITDSNRRKRVAHAVRTRVEDIFSWDSVAKQVDKEVKSF